MPLHPDLALSTYNLATGVVTERSAFIDGFDFTTTATGGYAELTCQIRVPNARIVPSDLQLFARVAVMDGPFSVFLGRWDEPGIALTDQDADVYQLHAMGGQDCLKDDPQDVAYSNQTPQTIAIDQISTFQVPGGAGSVARSAFIPLDQDTSLIFPSNPGALYSPDPNSKAIADVFNELIPLVGDYVWTVYGHPIHKDAAGFPTWQLAIHQRDTTTVAYTGYLAGEGGSGSDALSIKPAVEYSYNVVQVKYRDATSDLPSSVTVRDSRLNANNTQGSAPIPYRKIAKDFSSIHMSATEATQVANAVLSQYQNGGFKNEVNLARVFDANGKEIPLWQVRADANIYFPELNPVGAQLPTTVIQGTNLFYIQQTHYSEGQIGSGGGGGGGGGSGQTPTLTVTLDSFFDGAAFQVSRLEYIHKHKTASNKKKHVVREAGNTETGACGVDWGSNAVNGDVFGTGVNFKTSLSAAPASIVLTSSATSNTSGAIAATITNNGFELRATASGGGGYWRGSYLTT